MKKRTFYDFYAKFDFWRWLAQFFYKDYEYYFDRRNNCWCREIRNVQCRIEICSFSAFKGKPDRKVKMYIPTNSRWVHYAQEEKIC